MKGERLILLGLLVILLSILLPAGWAMEGRRRLAAARADLRRLSDAAQRFSDEYGRWPTTCTSAFGDCRFGADLPNAEIVNALRSVDGPGNAGFQVNSNRIVFLEVPDAAPGRSGLSPQGNWVDPWGTPYQVVFDTDQNNACRAETTVHATDSAGVLAWSCGPDRKSDTPDDILSR